jgi:hypothetical protein
LLPGDVGDVGDAAPPPHADVSVASVTHEAAWQAAAQNWRREM